MGSSIDLKKSIALVILIVLINSFILSVVAENLEWYPNSTVDGRLSTTSEDNEDILAKLDLDQYFEHYPMNSRSMGIQGTLIGPGNYTGTVDPMTNMFDIYTIEWNGTGNANIINFSVETTSLDMGVASLFSPDMFNISFDIFTNGVPLIIGAYAITQAYHYILVGNPLIGTVNYWLNLSTTETTNTQDDGNNDFDNATAASDGNNIQESLNYTLDYWDLFEVTIPPEYNLTVTCEPSSGIDVFLELFNASNSSEEHLIAGADDGWEGESEVLYYDSNVTQIDGFLRVSLWSFTSDPPFGDYWLNFSIKEINLKPQINTSNPKLSLWTSAAGVTIDEDEISDGEIVLSDQFMDDGKPSTPGALTYTYSSSDETNISVVVHANSSVTITPIANWFGNAVITFYANDSVFNVSDDLNVTVNSVNDIPVLELANNWISRTNNTASSTDGVNITCTQGQLVNYTVNASDIEGDTLTFSQDFNPNTTAWTEAPFTIEATTGNLNFTPDNDGVGEFEMNISVSDGTDEVWHNFTFIVANVNDPPMITKVDDITPVDKAVALTATQDVEFNTVITAADLDVARGLDEDALTFKAGTTALTTNEDNFTANYTFTPTNDDVGEIVVNITVMDEADTTVDDYVEITITVADVNDPPEITGATDDMGSAMTITNKMIDLTDDVLTKDAPNVTFTLTAADIDMPHGEVLDWDQNVATITPTSYMIEKENENKSAKITIIGEKLDNEVYTFNFTVMDDGTPSPLSDWVEVMVEVNITEEPQPPENQDPTITITTPAGQKIEIGKDIVIEGTWADPDEGDTVTILMASITPMEESMGFTDEPDEWDYYEDENLTMNADGTWRFVAETKGLKEAFDLAKEAAKALGMTISDDWLYGTYKFYFKAVDDKDGESDPVTISFEVEKEPGEDGGEDKGILGMGAMMDYVIIIIIIIIIIVIILAVVMRKKKVEEEVPPPEEGMVPAEGMPPAEVTCTACGATIPAGSPTCPACGAPAPPPEAAPPEAVVCPTCGATIPAGSPTCPACGAPAPPPAPPEGVVCPTCGATIPAGSPMCPACGAPAPPPAPPEEGMAPPPEEGMAPPPEEGMAPPPEEGMAPPPEGAPPEGMPPEGAPPEAPPPEGAPPEQAVAPPPGMATCPQCGAQIAVGTTPCPSCGTALNW